MARQLPLLISTAKVAQIKIIHASKCDILYHASTEIFVNQKKMEKGLF